MNIFGKKNAIEIKGNGNICFQDSDFTIQANDTEALQEFLRTATAEIKQELLGALKKQTGNVFENAKNIVAGHIEAGGNVYTGDVININYTPTKLCKELTAKIPCLDADKIIGRTTELDELHQMLHSNKQVVVMNGLGGIGKTTLAQVYARKYWDDYKHIAWITQTTDDIQFDFANEQALFHNLAIGKEFTDANAIFNEIVRKLKAVEEQPNLLIIDNADASLEKLRDNLPHQPHWHILITSRQELNGFTMKRLDFLRLEDALLLFKTHYTRNEFSDEQIENLIKAVEYHTLTIEILAKTAENYEYNFEELFNAIKLDLDTEISDIKHSENTIYRIGSYLSSIFKLNKLEPEEIWLIKQIVCLPSEYITYDVIKELILENKSNKKLRLILNKLAKKGWLLKNTESDSYKMHRIISEVINQQQQITIAECSFLIEMITDKLKVDDTKDNPVEKFQWIPYGNELLTIFEIYESKTVDEENKISILQNNLALRLKDLGDYLGAKKLLEKAMISDEKNYGKEHPSTAISYSNLALVLKDLGDYKEAKKLLEKAMISDEKNFGKDHPSTARCYSNLALALQGLGDYEEAKDLLGKAMISDEKNFGADHPSTATTYSNLALVLSDLGDYEGAKELLEKAIISDEKNFGTEHPSTAIRYSNLALILKDLGDYQRAKELLEKAIISAEKNFGADHPSTAISYSNLALVLQDLGDYEEAKKLMEKAMMSDEKNFGTEHPSTARCYSNLALLLYNLGDYKGALELSDKAVAVFQKVLPTRHPSIKTVQEINNYIKQKIK